MCRNTNLCMINDERAVPNTRARAELTATACKLPRPSLMMRKKRMKNVILKALFYFSKRPMAKNMMLHTPVNDFTAIRT